MQWSDFGPYVMPYVIGCPEPVMVHHARLATIEFCRKTLCWTEFLDDAATDGTFELEMDPGTNRQIIKVKTLIVDGIEWSLTETRNGLSMQTDKDESTRHAYTINNKILHINPRQFSGVPVRVLAALAPSRTATVFDDALTEHIQDIAEGAIESIQRLPAQAFTNMNDSMLHGSIFRERIRTIQMKVGRGHLAAKMSRAARFI